MTPRKTDLTMHEQIMLMALRDTEGTLEAKAGLHEYAIGGAILAELVLAGRVSIEDDKKKLVELNDRSLLGDDFLDEALELVVTAKRPRQADNWVYRFACIKNLRHRVAQQLCRRGILKESEDKVLWIFTRKVYPEIDSRPEDQLVEELRRAIFSDDSEVLPRTAIVLSLAHAAGMLEIHFDKKDVERRKRRIEHVTSGQAVGDATRATVEAVQVAMMVAQNAAAMTAITTAVNT